MLLINTRHTHSEGKDDLRESRVRRMCARSGTLSLSPVNLSVQDRLLCLQQYYLREHILSIRTRAVIIRERAVAIRASAVVILESTCCLSIRTRAVVIRERAVVVRTGAVVNRTRAATRYLARANAQGPHPFPAHQYLIL